MENDKNKSNVPFVKSSYYPGKLLHASDFIREQEYGNRKLEFINRKFHGWGIIEGLEIRIGKDGSLHLMQGSAIDPCGRIIVVPGHRRVGAHEIEGFNPEAAKDIVLGIQYAERTVEMEPALLEKEKRSQPAQIMETYTLRAFGETEFQRLWARTVGREEVLTEEKILYESETVTLAVRIPKVVPIDSIFRLRMWVRAAGEKSIRIGWRGMAKLQGALFVQSGENYSVLEEEQVVCSGSLQREWEICTEENRILPVLLEISHLEIVTEHMEITEVPACQFDIETAVSYEQTVKKYLENQKEQETAEDWVPLARLRMEESTGSDHYIFSQYKESNVRFSVVRPGEEEILRRIAEENGIFDIRWRKLLQHIWHLSRAVPPVPGASTPSAPFPPLLPGSSTSPAPFSSMNPGSPTTPVSFSPLLPGSSTPHVPGSLSTPVPGSSVPPFPVPQGDVMTKQQVQELLEADRKNRIRRGVAVISIPKHCRKRQILYSEEISHGFPGEEVLIWCGRMREEKSYAYWEHNKNQYRLFNGGEGLFSEGQDGWEIRQQALMQNVEAGTFQIALTVRKHHKHNRSREVAISWTAIRIG